MSMPVSVQQVEMGRWAEDTFRRKYSMDGVESWPECAHRVASNVLGALGYEPHSHTVTEVAKLIRERKFLPGGRYLYASGRDFHQVNNCLLMRAEDSREGWAELAYKSSMALMTGAGIGVVYSYLREKDALIKRTGGRASGPCALMHVVNESGRQYQQGGSRRSAIWAGLHWWHPDVLEFIRLKDWPEGLRALKERDINTWMPMELTNISVCLDDAFFEAYTAGDEQAHTVYSATVRRMLKTGEPGFSVDVGENAGEELRNACTEVTSADDSDVCNLGSLNLGRIESLEEMCSAVNLATLFLIAGTRYSDVPYDKVADVREQNRRLGLGLMGVHEWLLLRGKPYAPDAELGEWLAAYETSGDSANRWADEHGLSRPVKTRAIAPNGTIGIIGETTTSIEPMFCSAYKRTYLVGREWTTEYVIDPVAERLEREGLDADVAEDAYSLASDVERRLGMQRWIQTYVDHGISSTINLPAPITRADEVYKFENTLMEYLPWLRGVTVYPDGARSGQPIVAVPMAEARAHRAEVHGNEEACAGGVCAV